MEGVLTGWIVVLTAIAVVNGLVAYKFYSDKESLEIRLMFAEHDAKSWKDFSDRTLERFKVEAQKVKDIEKIVGEIHEDEK